MGLSAATGLAAGVATELQPRAWMSDQEIESRIRELAGQERAITAEVLTLLTMAEKRGLPAKRAYASTIQWMVSEFGYSEGAAYRRIQAARLVNQVPQVRDQLAKGDFSLSNLSKVQTVIRKHEHATKRILSNERKVQILDEIKKLSQEKAEKKLFELLPEGSKMLQKDRLQRVAAESMRLSVTLDDETVKFLKEARDLISSNVSTGNWSDVIKFLASDFVGKRNMTRSATAAGKQRVRREYIPLWIKRQVWQKAQNSCEYVDTTTGKKCTSTGTLEIDHIVPVAKGGSSKIENLRLLCRSHNRFYADEIFGRS